MTPATMPENPLWCVEVVRVRGEPGRVVVGQRLTTEGASISLGRAADASVRLDDATVSRRHAELTLGPSGICARVLTERGSTFVSGEVVEAGNAVESKGDILQIQLGRILLRVDVSRSPTTVSYSEALGPLDTVSLLQGGRGTRGAKGASEPPFFSFRWDCGTCHLQCCGVSVETYPAAARVLAAIAGGRGNAVSHADIQEAVGETTNIDQQVSYLRRDLRTWVEQGIVSIEALRRRVAEHAPTLDADVIESMDLRDLVRRFLSSRRGYGYQISLGASDVTFDPPR